MVSPTLRNSHSAPAPIQVQVAPSEPISQPTRRGRSRRTVATRFKGFDSDDETAVNMNSVPESIVIEHTAVESQSQGLFVTQDPEMDVDQGPSQQTETQTRSSRKRNSPPIDYDI